MSLHTQRIIQWFDIDHQPQTPCPKSPPLDFLPHRITFITGPSGAGKSRLLRQLVHHASRRHHTILDLQQLQLPNRAVIDLMAYAHGGDTSDEQTTLTALESLSRAGLGEVWTYLRTPKELSEGQRWRLKLAIAIETLTRPVNGLSSPLLLADEFTSLLDRITAHILSRWLRKALITRPIHAILATSHEDIALALQPDRIIRCDFGTITVEERRGNDESRNPNSETIPKPPMSKRIRVNYHTRHVEHSETSSQEPQRPLPSEIRG